jgi:D-glycero-alpha-D-manno-heptose-7-phosphate kinase
MIKTSGSVRVDLLGGTLDITPINLILKDVVTLNLATSLKAEVQVEEIECDGVEIISLDYDSEVTFSSSDFTSENLSSDFFGPLRFVVTLLKDADCTSGLRITLKSGSPPGAGLGGSSSMGVTLYKALCELKKVTLSRDEIIERVRAIEAKDLECGPTGYQDYYPAVYGGVLALSPSFAGIEVDQLYSDDLKDALESNITLVFSGETRLSGINNWEVYKAFFDGDQKTRDGLQGIATLSHKAYEAIKQKNYNQFLEFVKREGELRSLLYPGIVTDKMNKFLSEVKNMESSVGVKVCGAGGGGCFIVIHENLKKEKILQVIEKYNMQELPFSVVQPL